MIGNRTIYFGAQIVGWLLYAALLFFSNFLEGGETNSVTIIAPLIIAFAGIVVTHSFRWLIIKYDWLSLQLYKAIPLVLLASILIGFVLHFLIGVLHEIFLPEVVSFFENTLSRNIQLIINFTFIALFWSVLYFTTHYFFNYKREEIKNLKLAASQTETELINLKSQLNPHFMFNALNSIRALVDENPTLAKTAITQLSAMLRGALQTGKRQLISLEEEFALVKSYLAIEKIRFEERLSFHFDSPQEVSSYNIPPLLLQTLVENAVKHGISSLTKGGELFIGAKLYGEALHLTVSNSGKFNLNTKSEGTGIGLKNTRRRLGLLYGEAASISIENIDDKVLTTIIIPKNLLYENIDN